MNPKRNSSAVKSANIPLGIIAKQNPGEDSEALLVRMLPGATLSLLVKPNAHKTEILGWDASRNALRVAVAAKPEDNQANKELIRFFTNKLKKPVVLISGARSKIKVLRFV